MNKDEETILVRMLCEDYVNACGLAAHYNSVMHAVQIEHPQPGVNHPEAWLRIPAQQFIDNFNIYASGRLPENF